MVLGPGVARGAKPGTEDFMTNLPCPCGSGVKFKRCCRQYHRGTPVPNALLLMKARYSAYAVGDANFVMDTTHPLNSEFQPDRDLWARALQGYCRATQFTALTIREFVDGDARASVTFHATMQQGSDDLSFAERSTFVREDDRWLYRDGVRL
jgi:SEC-C motif-containing protein